MSLARHCNGPGCDSWQLVASAIAQAWLDVTEVLNFCSWDCCIKYGATKEPIEFGDL